MNKKRKSQTMLIYTALIVFVIITLIIMSGLIQRHIQGVYKRAGDSIGGGELKD